MKYIWLNFRWNVSAANFLVMVSNFVKIHFKDLLMVLKVKTNLSIILITLYDRLLTNNIHRANRLIFRPDIGENT